MRPTSHYPASYMKRYNAEDEQFSPSNDMDDEKESDKYKAQGGRYDPLDSPEVNDASQGTPKLSNLHSNECWPSSSIEQSSRTLNANNDCLPTVTEELSLRSSQGSNHSGLTEKRRGNDIGKHALESNIENIARQIQLKVFDHCDDETLPNQVGQTLMIKSSASDLSSITETCYSKSSQSARLRQEILKEILKGKIPHFLERGAIEKILRAEDDDVAQDYENIVEENGHSKSGQNQHKPSKYDQDNEGYAQNYKSLDRSTSSTFGSGCSRSSRHQKTLKSRENYVSPSSKNNISDHREKVSSSPHRSEEEKYCNDNDNSSMKSAQSWTNVAVYAASSVLEAGGSQRAAEAATTAILTVGSRLRNSRESGLAAAAEASSAVLATDNEQSAAAAAAVAVLKACGSDDPDEFFDERETRSVGDRNLRNSQTENNLTPHSSRTKSQARFNDIDSMLSNENHRIYSNKENLIGNTNERMGLTMNSMSSASLKPKSSTNVLRPRNQIKCEKNKGYRRPIDDCSNSIKSHYSDPSKSTTAKDLATFFYKSSTKNGKVNNNHQDSDLFSIKSSDVLNHVSDLSKYVASLMPSMQKKMGRRHSESQHNYGQNGGDMGTIDNQTHNYGMNSPENVSNRSHRSHYTFSGDSGTIKPCRETSSKKSTFDGDEETVLTEFELGSHLMQMEETSNEIELSILASRTKEILNKVKGANVSPTDERRTVLSKTRKHLTKLVSKNKGKRTPKFTFEC